MNNKPPTITRLPVTEQMLYSTARITSHFSGDQQAHGTGFFFKFCENGDMHVPCIVTNRHVVFGAQKVVITYRLLDFNGHYIGKDPHYLEINNPQSIIRYHPDKEIDLAAIEIGEIVNQGIAAGYKPFYVPLGKSLIPNDAEAPKIMVADSVLMVGYPNGLWDKHNNLPLARRGTISTLPKYDYNGRTEFVVDMACLYGSSGSPVFYYDINFHRHNGDAIDVKPKFKLLGVLYGGPEYEFRNEFQEVNFAMRAPILNLGYAIKAQRIMEIEAMITPRLKDKGK